MSKYYFMAQVFKATKHKYYHGNIFVDFLKFRHNLPSPQMNKN